MKHYNKKITYFQINQHVWGKLSSSYIIQQFDYKKYPEEVTVRERFKFKDIKKVKLIGGKITLMSKHHETVYDKDGKVLSKKAKKEGTIKTIYVPIEYIIEIDKDINNGFNKKRKNRNQKKDQSRQ